jgi:hypothetical protein
MYFPMLFCRILFPPTGSIVQYNAALLGPNLYKTNNAIILSGEKRANRTETLASFTSKFHRDG